jgi:transcriptional antiterminator
MSALQQREQQTDRAEPDYDAIEVPTDVPPGELHYMQRRAEVYDIVMAAGHPSAVSQAELAERFEVDQSTISRDLDRIDAYLRENTTGRRDLESHAVYQRAIRGLLQQEEYREAARVQKWYDEFRDSRIGVLEFRQRLDRLEDVAAERGGGR